MSPAPGRWLEVSVRVPADEEASWALADALTAESGRGVLERDGCYVSYFPDVDDERSFVASLRERLMVRTGSRDLDVSARWQPNEDWTERWKRGLRPKRLTDRIVVRPSWTQFQASDGDLVVVIDPGAAFGTAEHGTTRGCLRFLDRVVEPDTIVVDVGSGSGVLAVTAALLGARQVTAIEADRLAFDALVENLARNGVTDRVRALEKHATTESLSALHPVDGIVSNLEARLLRPLLPGFAATLRPGAWLVLSGVLADEWTTFRRDVEACGFWFGELDRDGEWTTSLWRRGGASGSA